MADVRPKPSDLPTDPPVAFTMGRMREAVSGLGLHAGPAYPALVDVDSLAGAILGYGAVEPLPRDPEDWRTVSPVTPASTRVDDVAVTPSGNVYRVAGMRCINGMFELLTADADTGICSWVAADRFSHLLRARSGKGDGR